LLDPQIDVRPSIHQIDDLLEEINQRIQCQERVLVTTLTKRMAEELTKYLDRAGVKCRYIHSDVKTLDRVEILRELRLGVFDVLIGVNLLREGLDLPEVSLVAILDADKEGFLRNVRSLIQTIGRAARNERGQVIMYADTMTQSMETAINETNRRRSLQMAYNKANNITPQSVHKSKSTIIEQTQMVGQATRSKYYIEEEANVAADPVVAYMSQDELIQYIQTIRKKMEAAAQALEFTEAARLRDELAALEKTKTDRRGY